MKCTHCAGFYFYYQDESKFGIYARYLHVNGLDSFVKMLKEENNYFKIEPLPKLIERKP